MGKTHIQTPNEKSLEREKNMDEEEKLKI